jgi:hypothetical protein
MNDNASGWAELDGHLRIRLRLLEPVRAVDRRGVRRRFRRLFCEHENTFGLTRSFPITPTKPQPAQIVLNPRPLEAEYGQTIQLKVTARGSGTVTFEWLKDGESLDLAKDGIEILNDYSPLEGHYSILTLKSLQTDDEGLYSVVASNQFGKMESTVAKLTVGPSQLFKFSSTSVEDDGYLRIEVVGPVNHDVIILVSSDFLKWKDMLTIPLNKPLPPADDSSGQPDLGSAELRLPVLPVGEDLEQKKVEIAVRLSKLAIAKWISDEPGIEVDPDSLEVELIFILSRDDTREQQLKQGIPPRSQSSGGFEAAREGPLLPVQARRGIRSRALTFHAHFFGQSRGCGRGKFHLAPFFCFRFGTRWNSSLPKVGQAVDHGVGCRS